MHTICDTTDMKAVIHSCQTCCSMSCITFSSTSVILYLSSSSLERGYITALSHSPIEKFTSCQVRWMWWTFQQYIGIITGIFLVDSHCTDRFPLWIFCGMSISAFQWVHFLENTRCIPLSYCVWVYPNIQNAFSFLVNVILQLEKRQN